MPTPSDTQVLVRVEAAAICGTDVDEVRLGPITVPLRPHPLSRRSAPITLGHEVVGVVAETGPASGVAVGARVAPWPTQPCGECRDCVAGRTNRCAFAAALGMSADGGMADYLVVEGSRCVPVGADVELERAVLVEPFAVALHGVGQVDVAGLRVGVVGIGSLGLCVIEAAVRAGAEQVIAVSRSEEALGTAREAGATMTLSPDRAGELDADAVFETAGTDAAVDASLAAVGRGGRVIVLGGHPQPTPVDLLDLVIREVTLQGSVSHRFEDFTAAAEAITAGELARTRRRVELAPLESGPALLRAEAATAKRILMPGLS